ncbi:MAG: DUF188 domain-containing protein [Spirochaetaceae bacterium]|nr:DUF188 domain-containing protein [Spirochaetaceae bacterium]
MKILVDADSCPRPARELVLRTAARRDIPAVFAANRTIPGIAVFGAAVSGAAAGDAAKNAAAGNGAVMELCPPGEGEADNRIVALAAPGDLVITRDIPLAERLLEKNVAALDDRGGIFTREAIRERLSTRNFLVALAESGLGAERKNRYGKRELKNFADALDRELTRLSRQKTGALPE